MIYLRVPDNAGPSGGTRLMYEMVDELNAQGMPARIWHGRPGFRLEWFENRTPVVNGMELDLQVGDVMVASEIWTADGAAEQLADARVVVLNMNHFETFRHATYEDRWKGDYPGWPNAVGVIVVGKASKAFVEMALRRPMPVHHVPLHVRSELFRPAPKENVIATMPRKRQEDMQTVIQLLHRSPIAGRWRFDIIDRVPFEEWARRVTRARIFLSASNREGCAFPPAEAMAAGCYVVGFTGDGCRDYMLPEFSSPIDDQNLAAFAAETVRIAQAMEAGSPDIQAKIDAGRDHVLRNYGVENWTTGIRTAFADLLQAAAQTKPVRVRHYKQYGKDYLSLAKSTARRMIPPAVLDRLRGR